ncbi:MAG: hypothetical protein PUE66_08080 [Erysipelotrichaceae bacterium]|nr:hypothetical protein [Erysipelotrichaceae bacterium]
MKASIRIKDLELRSCDEHLVASNENHTTMEISRWQNYRGKESCYVIAYFKVDKNELCSDLIFLGDRPFDKEVDKDTLWYLCKLGSSIIKECFLKCEDEDE